MCFCSRFTFATCSSVNSISILFTPRPKYAFIFAHVIRSKYHFSIFFGSNGVTFNTPLTRKRPLPEHFVHTSRLGSRVSKSFTVRNPFPLQRSHNFITSIFNMPSIVFISKIIIIFSTSGLSRFCRDPNIASRCGTNNIQLLIFNKNKS